MGESVGSPKRYGAKEMFYQSIIYLYNSYREEGLSVQEAKDRVSHDIEEEYERYVETGEMPALKLGISNPKVAIDNLIKRIDSFHWEKWRELSDIKKEETMKTQLDVMKRELYHIKSLFK